jgi:hypothetical protein
MEWLSLIPLGGLAALAMVYLKHREISLKEREIVSKKGMFASTYNSDG